MKRLLKKGKLFQLVQFSRPIIAEHTKLISDNKKGGIVLTYITSDVLYTTILGKNYIVRSVKHHIKRIFFRPLKKDWRREIYKIDKIYWGKKNHLLTRLWLEVDRKFKDIHSVDAEELKKAQQCKDAKLIKNLNVAKDTFIL